MKAINDVPGVQRLQTPTTSRPATVPLPYAKPNNGLKIAHVGTYPPRQCGIATYTQDVVSAVHSNTPAAPPTVVAMAAPGEDITYGWPVRHVIRQDHLEDYASVARALCDEGVDLVSVQHEHGIFGGEAGASLNVFLDAFKGRVPVVTTFHTVLPRPGEALRRTLRDVARRSDRIVVLNSRAIPLLQEAYGLPAKNVVVIPHGTPRFDASRRPLVRARLGLDGQTVLSTFGLLGPGKGLEHAIAAVADNAATYPHLHYHILGATHPGIVRESGESYREGLVRLAEERGVSDRIHFVNRYLALDELTDWLIATDLYVTPYLNPDQIVSGTLSYAVAAGRPVLSTPYLHALELLEGGAGQLTPFHDPAAMAANLDRLLAHPIRLNAMGEIARVFGCSSAWPEVAMRYWETYLEAVGETDHRARASASSNANRLKAAGRSAGNLPAATVAGGYSDARRG